MAEEIDTQKPSSEAVEPASAGYGFIWMHEICGGNPVHPETRVCVQCKRPTFSNECFKVPLTKEWMEKHPKGKSYFVRHNAPTHPPDRRK